MYLTLAGIIKFSKKEIWITQNAKFVSIKIDFAECILAEI